MALTEDIQTGLWVAFVAAEVAVLLRAMLRPHREPTSRLAWVIVILVLPVVGMIGYLLLGEARVSARRRKRGRAIDAKLPRPPGDPDTAKRVAASLYEAPFALAASVNGLCPTQGNRATLAADSNAAIDGIVADIDAATDHAHLCFYIWLSDTNGLKLKDAVVRAAKRGVAVRVLADALGSQTFVRSKDWQEMKQAGAEVRVALPVGNLLWTMLRGRVDLRNHRKAVIVDDRIAWCGSQNAADPEFRIKPRYAPWVDAMTRWEGPVAQHWQYLFVSDWMGERGEDLSALLTCSVPPATGGVIAQVIGTGPTVRYAAMTACFAEVVHSARRAITITTPYFVPDEQLLFAILSAARRGVVTKLLLPARNDSKVVAAASRSHYRELIAAGVELWEYGKGLLHAKTMVVDGCVGLVGSANLDRRSFELNFENNILFMDEAFAGVIAARQAKWLADCTRVTIDDVNRDGILKRLWQNFLSMFGPLL